MPDNNKITQIGKVGRRLEPTKPSPQKGEFDDVMKQQTVENKETTKVVTDTETTKVVTDTQKVQVDKTVPTLMEEVRKLNTRVDHVTRASQTELAEQTDDLIAQIDDLKHKLETPDFELKQSVQTVLKNKIHHIDESLKVALDKAGIEYVAPNEAAAAGLKNPVERFLGLLSNGQEQLHKLSGHIQTIQGDPKLQNPAYMLLIQIKVHHIQQEIELFTALLNKALESVKTTLNVQV